MKQTMKGGKMIRAEILQNEEGVFLTKVISVYLTRKGSEK